MRFYREEHGGDLRAKYDFSVNVSPLGTSGRVRSAMVSALSLADRYPDPCAVQLRAALSAKEGVPAENILAGNGAAELIYAYAAYGGSAVVVAPTFSEYAAAFRAFGKGVRFARGYGLEGINLCATDTVFVCIPNNPDGFFPAREELFSLAERCRAAGASLFADACFYDFVQNPSFTLAELVQSGAFVLQAFTKSYALAGVRLGYLMGEEGALSRISRYVQPWSVSCFAQAAGIAAAGDKQYLSDLRALVSREREFLSEGMTALGFAPRPSRANFLLFEGEEGLSARLRERGIAVRVCDDFEGLVPQKGKKYYRVGVRTREENQILLQALREVLQ